MGFYTEQGLRNYSGVYYNRNLQENIKTAASQAEVRIFLSHSHKDKDVVKGFIAHLAAEGVEIYVDWNDTEMPRITSGETAQQIKQKINELELFMLLATPNALRSRWVPWELGVADQMKGYDRIVIVPIVGANQAFQGNEYIQIYKRFEPGTQLIHRRQVLQPNEVYYGKPAAQYLKEHRRRRPVLIL